jgi:phosphate uptake regulator
MELKTFFKYFQRKTFLEETLKSMNFDVIKMLLEAIDALRTVGNLDLEDDPTESEKALEQIASYVDNIDTANGLCHVFWLLVIWKQYFFFFYSELIFFEWMDPSLKLQKDIVLGRHDLCAPLLCCLIAV